MENNWIERYVYDVARRLPEKDREEVKKELRANIYDMLPENAGDEQVKKVLYELGSPASLAEKYRQKPRYLISPAYYDEYVRVLKWVLPLVGVVVMVIGFAVGAFDAVKAGSSNYAFVASGIISKGISMGISAAFQALVWTTVGFAIAERSGEKTQKAGEHGWRVEDLSEVQKNEKANIALSESIAELIVILVFSVLGLLFCTGRLPFMMAFSNGDIQFYNIFSDSFLALCVPVILVSLALAVVEGIAKIRDRRWSVFVCSAVVLKSLVDMAFSLFLINRPNLFGTEFHDFLAGAGVLNVLPDVNGVSVLIVALSVLIVIGTVSECVSAIAKTVKSGSK
ncbi:MAG: hypothetical protein VB034_01015 [Eubacteriales bacterium]|nr:hypothetical protein [Eubacteriales bacterium]